MSIRKAVYSLMSGLEGDVYPIYAKQELTVPYAVYSTDRNLVLTQEGVKVYEVRVTVDIYANDFSDCVDLAETLEAGMHNASGTYATETLMVCNLESERDSGTTTDLKINITQEYLLKFTA